MSDVKEVEPEGPALEAEPEAISPTFLSLQKALEAARARLLDMSLRNKLISTNVATNRARQVLIVDRASDDIFRLLRAGRSLGFLATVPRGQQPDEELGSLATSDDGPISVDAQEAVQRENQLSVRMTPEGLTKRLTTMFYEGRTLEEEQGVSILFLALGFLEWREAGHSEKERFAPLVLQPVELERAGARDRYKLKARQDDLYTNVSLQAWLDQQFGIELPELPEADDWAPSTYFDQVEAAVGTRPGWSVRRDDIALGFFSFSKFLMWRDLHPENWPDAAALTDDDLLKKILLRSEEKEAPDEPLISDEERLDDVFSPSDLIHVTDADSSQAIAIQEALAGKNLVIQGPPGTGKSQTITNIIAGAVKAGKRVLFVAEKMAALEVVHQRLVERKLGAMCLELHSRKASKAQVMEQIRQAKTAPSRPGWPNGTLSALADTQSRLRAHSDRMHELHDGMSAFDLIGRISLLNSQETPTPSFTLAEAADWSVERLETEAQRAAQLGERFSEAGPPREHPWRGIGIASPDQLEQARLKPVVERVARSAAALATAADGAREALALVSDDAAKNLATWADALEHVSARPAAVDELLGGDGLMPLIQVLLALAADGERLLAIRSRLTGKLRPEAWSMDWSVARRVIAGHGRSLFRMLSGRYREAVADLRGAWVDELPASHEVRLKALDDVIDGQRLAVLVLDSGASIGGALGSVWKGEQTDWGLLNEILAWLTASMRFEPAIQLRNPKRLIPAENARELATALRAEIEGVRTAIGALFEAIQLDMGVALDGRSWDDLAVQDLLTHTALWRERFEDITQWPAIRDGLAWLSSISCEPMAQEVFDGTLGGHQVEGVLRLAMYEAKWRKLCKECPEVAEATGDELTKFVARFRKADNDRISMASDEVGRAHADGRPAGAAGAVGILEDEMRKSRNLKPVRKVMELAGDAVQAFKPVFLMSPLSVAQYLPPGAVKFDLLVIDEASQVRPEDAIGVIARCDQVVVVGDNKQLPPTNFFNRMVNDIEDVDDEEDYLPEGAPRRAVLRDIESILDLCSRFPERMLRWHYRSEHPSLIAISNRRFYRDQLLLPPSVIAGVTDGSTGLIFHRVAEGGYDRGKTRQNEIEAEDVAAAALKHARECPELSLGIGAFSVAQRDAIRDRLDPLCALHPELDEFIKGRTVDGGERREPLFVKNLENIQGDERDVIFISVGYGKDADGRFYQSFGPVGLDGGERRLNVLITRARKRCEVFSSIVAEDIRIEGAAKPGVVALKEFLKLAKDGQVDTADPTGKGFDSDFEEAVAFAIRALGYEVHPQVGTAGFFVDIGVIDPRNSHRYILGVECDGAAYHSSRYARDRDRLRQMILEKRGWKLHRIWSTDWFYRREREIAKLKDAIEAVLVGRPIPKAANIYDFEFFGPKDLPLDRSEAEIEDSATPAGRFGFEDPSAAGLGTKLRPYEFARFQHWKTEPHTSLGWRAR